MYHISLSECFLMSLIYSMTSPVSSVTVSQCTVFYSRFPVSQCSVFYSSFQFFIFQFHSILFTVFYSSFTVSQCTVLNTQFSIQRTQCALFHPIDSKPKLNPLTIVVSGTNYKMSSLTMKEWVINSLYSELIQKPFWTLAAFGLLEEGQSISSSDVRYRLISYLIVKHMNECPHELWDDDYRSAGWKILDYIPCIKVAVKRCREMIP